MVYAIELSFTTKQITSVDNMLTRLEDLCDYYDCMEKYHITETRGEKYNYDTIYVFSCTFDCDTKDPIAETIYSQSDRNETSSISSIPEIPEFPKFPEIPEIPTIQQFLKEVKKIKHLHVDSIINETYKPIIIYMSPHYLRSIPKDQRKQYIEEQRQRSYTETDYLILKEFVHEISKYNKEFVEENNKRFIVSYDEYLNMTKQSKKGR